MKPKIILSAIGVVLFFGCEKPTEETFAPHKQLAKTSNLQSVPQLVNSLIVENSMFRFINRESFVNTISILDNQNTHSADELNQLMNEVHDQLTYLDFLDETENFEDVDDYEVDSLYDFGHYTFMTLLNYRGKIWIGDTIYKITKPEIQKISPETGQVYETLYDVIQGPTAGLMGSCEAKRTTVTGKFDNGERKVRHDKYRNEYIVYQAIGMKAIHYKKNWRGKFKRKKVSYIRVQLYVGHCVKWYYANYPYSLYTVCGWDTKHKNSAKRVSKNYGAIYGDDSEICWEEFGKTGGHINWGSGPYDLDLKAW